MLGGSLACMIICAIGDIIRKGFKMAGIDDAIDLDIEPEDPFEDLNV